MDGNLLPAGNAVMDAHPKGRRSGYSFAIILVSIGGIVGTVGVLIGLLVNTATVSPSSQVAPATDGTIEVHVKAELILPSPTVTTIPSSTPTEAPTVIPSLNWCGTATPGALCEVPPLPTETATLVPDCANMDDLDPGDFCRWP